MEFNCNLQAVWKASTGNTSIPKTANLKSKLERKQNNEYQVSFLADPIKNQSSLPRSLYTLLFVSSLNDLLYIILLYVFRHMLRILYLHWPGDIPLVLPCYPEHLSIGRAILITPDVLSTKKRGGLDPSQFSTQDTIYLVARRIRNPWPEQFTNFGTWQLNSRYIFKQRWIVDFFSHYTVHDISRVWGCVCQYSPPDVQHGRTKRWDSADYHASTRVTDAFWHCIWNVKNDVFGSYIWYVILKWSWK